MVEKRNRKIEKSGGEEIKLIINVQKNRRKMDSNNLGAIKNLIKNTNAEKRFNELLGENAPNFISSALQVISGNSKLQEANPQTVMNAVVTAAILNLPINPNLGFAWIVPYKGEAQFQIGWKGFVQLAQRSKQYRSITVVTVYENQFESWNPLTETLFGSFEEEGKGKVAGYAAYFKLHSGFEKLAFWRRAKVDLHAKKFSKTYDFGNSVWKKDFDAMALKTVLKNTLSKWGPLSFQLEQAIQVDQSVQDSEGKLLYPDNDSDKGINPDKVSSAKEKARVLKAIKEATTRDELKKLETAASKCQLSEVYLKRADELK